MPRIVSFLPSATEMVCALGLSDSLVGITHECDYPESIKSKPVVVRNLLPIETMSQSEIDRTVAERMRQGLSLYQIDEKLLAELAPDLILTQNLCQVCAPSGNEVSQVLKALTHEPEILWMTPQSIGEIFQTLQQISEHLGPYSSFASEHASLFFNLPAVRENRVYAVDANSYFARPGPRVVEGAELLAHLFHPNEIPWHGPAESFQQVDLDLLRGSLTEPRDYYREGDAVVFTKSYLKRRGYCCGSGCRHCPY